MVNYYTCSQYLTGPAPCPSVQHPDSTPTHTEGRARRQAHLFCPLCWICIQRLTWPGRWKTNCPCKKKMCLYESLENLNLIILEVLHIIWGFFFILCKSLLCVRTRWDALRYRHVSPIYIYCCRLTCTNTHTHTYAPWRELRRYEKTGGREAREQQEAEKDFGHVSESEGKRNKRGWLNGVFKRVQSALWCLQIINHVMSNNHGR